MEFLRFCLDEKRPIPDNMKKIVWSDLLDFAKKQSIIGVFFHGMKRITEGENKPTDDDVLDWMAETSKIVKRNETMYQNRHLLLKLLEKKVSEVAS